MRSSNRLHKRRFAEPCPWADVPCRSARFLRGIGRRRFRTRAKPHPRSNLGRGPQSAECGAKALTKEGKLTASTSARQTNWAPDTRCGVSAATVVHLHDHGTSTRVGRRIVSEGDCDSHVCLVLAGTPASSCAWYVHRRGLRTSFKTPRWKKLAVGRSVESSNAWALWQSYAWLLAHTIWRVPNVCRLRRAATRRPQCPCRRETPRQAGGWQLERSTKRVEEGDVRSTS